MRRRLIRLAEFAGLASAAAATDAKEVKLHPDALTPFASSSVSHTGFEARVDLQTGITETGVCVRALLGWLALCSRQLRIAEGRWVAMCLARCGYAQEATHVLCQSAIEDIGTACFNALSRTTLALVRIETELAKAGIWRMTSLTLAQRWQRLIECEAARVQYLKFCVLVLGMPKCRVGPVLTLVAQTLISDLFGLFTPDLTTTRQLYDAWRSCVRAAAAQAHQQQRGGAAADSELLNGCLAFMALFQHLQLQEQEFDVIVWQDLEAIAKDKDAWVAAYIRQVRSSFAHLDKTHPGLRSVRCTLAYLALLRPAMFRRAASDVREVDAKTQLPASDVAAASFAMCLPMLDMPYAVPKEALSSDPWSERAWRAELGATVRDAYDNMNVPLSEEAFERRYPPLSLDSASNPLQMYASTSLRIGTPCAGRTYLIPMLREQWRWMVRSETDVLRIDIALQMQRLWDSWLHATLKARFAYDLERSRQQREWDRRVHKQQQQRGWESDDELAQAQRQWRSRSRSGSRSRSKNKQRQDDMDWEPGFD